MLERIKDMACTVLGLVLLVTLVWGTLASGIIGDAISYAHPFGPHCAQGVLADVFESLRCESDSRPAYEDTLP